MKTRVLGMAVAGWLAVGMAHAQEPKPVQPSAATVENTQAQQAIAPQAPKPLDANPFPAIDSRNFTIDSPTRDEVDSFLKALWGYDENRIWQVAAILKTPAPGVAKVVVFVADKTQPGRPRTTVFFVTPDGKHAIADNVIDFGARPFAAARATLQQKANGPAVGAKDNQLLIVEFVDLQDARSRQAQDIMANLANDFPQARIVTEPLPLTEVHPFAMRAALYGACVRSEQGDPAYFTYQKAVFSHQESLTIADAEKTLIAAATAAGASPTAVATCVDSAAAKTSVEAGIQLANELGVDQTPVLEVNGHLLPLSGVPYDTLRKIVAYQANQDGIPVHLQPLLTNLK